MTDSGILNATAARCLHAHARAALFALVARRGGRGRRRRRACAFDGVTVRWFGQRALPTVLALPTAAYASSHLPCHPATTTLPTPSLLPPLALVIPTHYYHPASATGYYRRLQFPPYILHSVVPARFCPTLGSGLPLGSCYRSTHASVHGLCRLCRSSTFTAVAVRLPLPASCTLLPFATPHPHPHTPPHTHHYTTLPITVYPGPTPPHHPTPHPQLVARPEPVDCCWAALL